MTGAERDSHRGDLEAEGAAYAPTRTLGAGYAARRELRPSNKRTAPGRRRGRSSCLLLRGRVLSAAEGARGDSQRTCQAETIAPAGAVEPAPVIVDAHERGPVLAPESDADTASRAITHRVVQRLLEDPQQCRAWLAIDLEVLIDIQVHSHPVARPDLRAALSTRPCNGSSGEVESPAIRARASCGARSVAALRCAMLAESRGSCSRRRASAEANASSRAIPSCRSRAMRRRSACAALSARRLSRACPLAIAITAWLRLPRSKMNSDSLERNA